MRSLRDATALRTGGVWLLNRIISIPLPFSLRRAVLSIAGATVNKEATIHAPTTFLGFDGISIGAMSSIGVGTFLDGRGNLEIGDSVMIGAGVRIYTAGHNIHSPTFETSHRAVRIGDGAILFPYSAVMPGVTIGYGATILSHAVVVRDVPAWTVVGGNPASEIGPRTMLADLPDVRFRFHGSVI